MSRNVNADTGHGSPPGAVTVIWDCLIAGADPTEGKDLPMPPTYNVTVITSVRAQQGRGKKGEMGLLTTTRRAAAYEPRGTGVV